MKRDDLRALDARRIMANTMSLSSPVPLSDEDLHARVRHGDERAFRVLFERYDVPLCRYGTTLLDNPDASEDVVQALFVRIWDGRKEWLVRGSVRGYLYRAVHRRIANEWRHGPLRELFREIYEAMPEGADLP